MQFPYKLATFVDTWTSHKGSLVWSLDKATFVYKNEENISGAVGDQSTRMSLDVIEFHVERKRSKS